MRFVNVSKIRTCMTLLVLSLVLCSITSCGFRSGNAANERVFNGAPGIWFPPPQGHFNGFITNFINLGIYLDLVEQPMAIYNWGDDKWIPMLATSWDLDTVNNTYTMHLRHGVKWHDGTNFSSRDVVDTFTIYYMMNLTLWSKRYIDKCYATDDYTVVFHIKNPSSVSERFFLRTSIKPSSVFGKIADQIRVWQVDHMYLSDYDNLVKEMEKFYIGVADAQTKGQPMPKLYVRNRNEVNYLLAKRPDKYGFLVPIGEMFDETQKIMATGQPIPAAFLKAKQAQIAKYKDAMKADLKKMRDTVKPTRDLLNATKPDARIGTGPFMVNMKDVNEAQITLRPFKDYWDKGKVKFDKVILYNGETPTITPMLMAHEVDYATHGFPVATQRQLIKDKFTIMKPPTYGGLGLGFNHRPQSYPLNKVEVRQAIAYLINRKEVAYVTFADAAKPHEYMVGFVDRMVPRWVHPEVIAKLNKYEHNPQKAEAMFKALGFKRGVDGYWIDDRGKRMKFSLLCVLEYADLASAAENVTLQLRKFGIDVDMRAVTSAQWPDELNQGRYDLAMRIWGGGNPHPYFQFQNNLLLYNYPLKLGPGMNFPMLQVVEPYGKVDLEELVQSCSEGFDKERQMKDIDILALAYNQQLPIIPIYERFGNNPVLEGVRIAKLPKESPYYFNGLYLDNFLVLMMLDGTLRPPDTAPVNGGQQ